MINDAKTLPTYESLINECRTMAMRLEAIRVIAESTNSSPNTDNLQFFCCQGKEHKCSLNVKGECIALSCQYKVSKKQQASA